MKTLSAQRAGAGISAACHAETYPAPAGPSQSDFGGVACCNADSAYGVKGR